MSEGGRSEGGVGEGGRETGPYVTFLDQAPVDQAVAALAVAQHCVFGLDQLRELGLSATAIRRRSARARLHRIHQSVYSLVPRELLTRRGHWMAAVLACGPGAVLSHHKAAALHGLRESARAAIDVTVPRRSALRRPGIEVHRAPTLTPADVTVVDGIPVTSVARTLFDLAEVVDGRALERAFDQSEVLEVFDLHAINDQIERNPTRAAAPAVQRVLDEHYIGSTLTENDYEEAMFMICRRYGVALPLVQEWIDLGDGEGMIRADFAWRPQRLIVETDSKRFHGTHQAKERDPRRDQRVMVGGWNTLRTTWRQVFRRPDELGTTLVRLVGVSG